METADGPVHFRILAGAAQSWSTLIVESEPGALFIHRLRSGSLELIHRDAADELIADRTYRPWLGSQAWTPLAELPVAGLAAWPTGGHSPSTMDTVPDQLGE